MPYNHFTTAEMLWKAKIPPNCKFVALCILKHRNNKNGFCFPSQETISKETGLSKPTVKRAIKQLEELAIIEVERSHRHSNQYYFIERTKYQTDTL
jgi:DNA-binding MarR family transcriptional regulator